MTIEAPSPLLVVDRMSVSYGSARVLFDVSFDLNPGETLAILGPNGAGKSSLAQALCGLVRASKGRVLFDGEDITAVAPHRISKLGLVYIPEGRAVFPGLTVHENLRLFVRDVATRRDRDEAVQHAFSLFPVLGERRTQRAGTLSGGEQQMLALSRILIRRPRLVIADEASLGLAPMMVDRIFDGLRQARSEGVALIVIEQFVQQALSIADRCLILQRGREKWIGSASDAKDEVLAQYLGSAEGDMASH